MNKQKLLKKILTAPTNVRFSNMVALIEAFGFRLARVSGSHPIFGHPGRLTRRICGRWPRLSRKAARGLTRMNHNVLLDTNVVIALFAAERAVLKRRKKAQRVSSPFRTASENREKSIGTEIQLLDVVA